MHAPQPPAPKPMTFSLAAGGLALVALMTLVFAALPAEYRVWNASVVGALALFAAARLGLGYGLVFLAAAIAVKDVCLYLTTDWWQPYPLSWLYFAGYALLGYALLRKSESVGRAAAVGLGASLGFFLVSNFVSWLEQALPYGYSFDGLRNCYAAAVPFFRGTLLGDVVFTAALFGAHAALARTYFPAEQVNAALVPQEAEAHS